MAETPRVYGIDSPTGFMRSHSWNEIDVDKLEVNKEEDKEESRYQSPSPVPSEHKIAAPFAYED